MMILKMVIMRIKHIITIIAIISIMTIIAIIADCYLLGWLASVGSRVIYELDYKKPTLYVVPIQNILGQTFLGTCRGHRYYSAQHAAQHLFGRYRRPQTRCRRRMPNVVRQLVGIGMVP